jgi:hypothetical protein
MVPFYRILNNFSVLENQHRRGDRLRMWMAIQLTICAVFLALAAYWVGRFFGKRKYLKLHEEMKALEMSFNHLIEEMELASSHNMKVIEKQSEELSELLTIADKKILRVNDFLKELDETAAELKRKANFNNSTIESVHQPGDRKFRQEMNEAIEELQHEIRQFSNRLLGIENQPPAEPKIDFGAIREAIEEEVSRQISRQLDFLEQQLEPASPPEVFSDRIVPIRPVAKETGFSTKFVARGSDKENVFAQEKFEQNKELKSSNITENVRIPKRKTDLGPEPRSNNPELKPGSPVYEVVKMAEEGVSLPQIARSMGMGKAKIELILKMYGSEINMRNVV